ncbi:AAA family ATPase [Cyanobacterium sp. Dongsha4]|uniref:AAA family ATPase n=1 Tax=Cyanobacterium sp. DS4 TaxID=2878255 RepID=UPI002E80E67C|nr:AAA family ATPase [Cyanobacterium sp. Dongsha4]WVK99610.1 AAA family ATPase [Cyanobacterium sp. Dongsha4]
MFTNLTVKNFRCFQNLTLNNISRLNLIGGMNNVGKTSLLEAIFLLLGANIPDLSLRINMFRGIEQFTNNYETMWGWLFNNKKIDNIIELIAENKNETKPEILTINLSSENFSLSPQQNMQDKPKSLSSLTTELIPNKLNLTYKKGDLKVDSNLMVTPEGLITGKREPIYLKPGIFISSKLRSNREDTERFSNLEKKNRQDKIVNILQLLEPRLERLAVLIEGGLPMIAGDIGIGELIPIAYMGEGISRLLSIILAIATTENGVVLIDEIENGLHYSKITDIWKGIDLISRQTNTQIFATTHSFECITSAHQAFNNDSNYDFTYHRLERVNDFIQVFSYDKETINTSVEMNFEMR